MTLKFDIKTISPSLAGEEESGGGGGGGTTGADGVFRNGQLVPQRYIDFENIVKNDTRPETEFNDYLNVNYDKIVSIGFLYPDGFSNFQIKQLSVGLVGIYFSDGTLLKADVNNINSFLPEHTYGANLEDTPKGYRYVILYYQHYKNSAYDWNELNSTFSTSYFQQNDYNFPKAVEYMVLNGTLNSFANMSNFYSLRGIGITENYSLATITNPVLPKSYTLQYLPSAAELFGNYTYTTVPQMRGQNSNLVFYPPYELDLTGITEDFTFNNSSYIVSGRIKLPAVNISTGTNVSNYFDYDTWAYMAQTAPTVTDKTLTIGQSNLNLMGGSSGTTYQTFINKGWTITTS